MSTLRERLRQIIEDSKARALYLEIRCSSEMKSTEEALEDMMQDENTISSETIGLLAQAGYLELSHEVTCVAIEKMINDAITEELQSS